MSWSRPTIISWICYPPSRSTARRNLMTRVNIHYPTAKTEPIWHHEWLFILRSRFSSSCVHQKESLQPQNFYELFPDSLSAGPPPRGKFHIDIKQLRREYLRLQSKAHPDRHSQENKSRAEAASARINEAFKTLQDPLLRAQYLLSLRGIDVAEDETAKVEDPSLLMEVLEAREEIEAVQSEEELEPLKLRNEERVMESVKGLEKAFEANDVAAAKHEAVKLRYWINIKESLSSWKRGKPIILVH